MRITRVDMDEHEMPATVHVVMTLAEAAYLGKLTGQQTGTEAAELMGTAGERAVIEVHNCLANGLIGRFYGPGGMDMVARRVNQ